MFFTPLYRHHGNNLQRNSHSCFAISHSPFAIHTRTHFVARERAALIIWGAARTTYNKAAPTMPI